VTWGETAKPGRAVWIRLLKLDDAGRWLSVRTEFLRGRGSRLVFAHSADRCRTWTDIGRIESEGRNLDNGMLFRRGDGSGPILLACRSVALDKSSGRLPVYRSDDEGRSWTPLGLIDASEVEPDQIFGLGLWEPFLYELPDGRLAAAYADERHAQEAPPFSQICAIRTSTDGGATWGDERVLTSEPGGGKLRPGMPVIARRPDGKYVAIYEVVGVGDAQVFTKISDDGWNWPAGLGHKLEGHRAGPYILAVPGGRLLATSCSGRLSWSDDGGETWRLADTRGWSPDRDPEKTWLTWPSLFDLGQGEVALTNSSLGSRPYEIRFGRLEGLTVRVDPAAGAPRLVVNGQPVRSRMFWGAPGTSPIEVGTDWKDHAFEFHARGDAENATLHIRFGQAPGDTWIDSFTITDQDDPAHPVLLLNDDFESGDFRPNWTHWPTGPANTVGTVDVVRSAGTDGETSALHVGIRPPRDEVWPDFHIYTHPRMRLVKGHRYAVTFRAKASAARSLTIAVYRPGTHYTMLGGPGDRFASQIRLAAQAGVDFVSFPVGLPWPRPGEEVDWSDVDAAGQMVLDANPRALLLPRIGMEVPAWWGQEHPDEMMRWEDGSTQLAQACVASPLYLRDAAERLSALVTHLEARFGSHVAGYHPCGQNTGEWFYKDTWLPLLSGYAPADERAWRSWLSATYPDDAAIRLAWHRDDLTRATAPVPSAAERHASTTGTFRDPRRERHLIDWARFQQESMAACVTNLAAAVRHASGGRKLVVFFYGYVHEFGTVANGPSVSGHYALRKVLDCPDIDVLCSPISYFDRGLGQGAPSMTAAESVALAGKLWLNEDDTHTYLATGNQPGYMEHVTSLEATNAELTRNVAQESLRNFGTWWMDLGSSGWFDDPGMWDVMRRLEGMDRTLLQTPIPFRPEVAVVVDEASMDRVTPAGSAVTRPVVYESRRALGRMGAPYGQYLLDDVVAGRVPDAKVLVVLNAWALDAKQRAGLLAASRGKAVVWSYAPGFFDAYDMASADAVRDLTGFRLGAAHPKSGKARLTAGGQALGLSNEIGNDQVPQPLLMAEDAERAEILAAFDDGSAAVAVRRRPDGGVSVFVGAVGLTPDLLRAVARLGRAHLYAKKDCYVWANGPFVAIHAAEDGPIALDLGRPGAIRDVMRDEPLGAGPVLTIPLSRGETRVLEVQAAGDGQ
jgi:hypothetical protein